MVAHGGSRWSSQLAPESFTHGVANSLEPPAAPRDDPIVRMLRLRAGLRFTLGAFGLGRVHGNELARVSGRVVDLAFGDEIFQVTIVATCGATIAFTLIAWFFHVPGESTTRAIQDRLINSYRAFRRALPAWIRRSSGWAPSSGGGGRGGSGLPAWT